MSSARMTMVWGQPADLVLTEGGDYSAFVWFSIFFAK